MDKLVYLHELDSARNTEEEIKIGQEALYEEIVINGNRVVMTFNQLTDAVAFLRLIDKEERCNNIVELFKTGYIKLSSYAQKKIDQDGNEKIVEINTASQYIQQALEKEEDTNKKGNTFVFTGLPLKTSEVDLRKLILSALRYSNPNLLDKYESIDADDKKRIEYFKRYVNMLLTLSREKLANNPIKDSVIKRFSDYMNLMKNIPLKQYFAGKESIVNYIDNAMKLLNEVEKQIIENKENIDARSTWINNMERYICNVYLKCDEKFETLDISLINAIYMAEVFVHLAYNYAVEDSIHNISKHYEDDNINSFYTDFSNRLLLYWDELTVKKIHRVIVREKIEGKNCEIKKDDNKCIKEKQSEETEIGWETAVRVTGEKKLFSKKKDEISKTSNKKSEKENSEKIRLYEDNYIEEKRKWRKKLRRVIKLQVVIATIYIGIFIAMDYASGWLEDGVAWLLGLVGIELNAIGAFFFNVIVYMIVLGGVTAKISEKINLPDIIESIKDICASGRDIRAIKKARRGVSYVLNRDKLEEKK